MKKGVSGVVVTVLVILIAIAGVSVLISVMKPAEKIKSRVLESEVSIVDDSAYTFFDPLKKTMTLQVHSDSDSMCEQIQVIVTLNDSVATQLISYYDAPPAGGNRRYTFDLKEYSVYSPIDVRVAPYCYLEGNWVLGDASLLESLSLRIESNDFYEGQTFLSPSGSSNPSNDTCYLDANCPPVESAPFCTGSYSCVNVTTYMCNGNNTCVENITYPSESCQLCSLRCNWDTGSCEVVDNGWCDGSDINRDGVVDSVDNDLWQAAYGMTNCSLTNNWCSNADINHDGTVDGFGFLEWQRYFGRTDCYGVNNDTYGSCYDSDLGLDFFVKGYTNSTLNGFYDDYCIRPTLNGGWERSVTGTRLVEHYCNGNYADNYKYEDPNGTGLWGHLPCEYGCSNGACRTCTQKSSVTEDEIPLYVYLNSTTFFGRRLDDSDLRSLQDTAIIVNGSSYDIHEEILLGNMELARRNNRSFLINRYDLEYRYVFEDPLLFKNTLQNPITIYFLGRELQIINITSNGIGVLVYGQPAFYGDGYEYIGQDARDPIWVWTISNPGRTGGYIGVKYNLELDDLNDVQGNEKVKFPGQAYTFPENYGSVRFDSWNNLTSEGQVTVTVNGNC